MLLTQHVSSQYAYQANNRVSEVWHAHGLYEGSPAPTWPGSNISAELYGYAPDGQQTWEARQSDGGASGNSFQDGTGENYSYNGDGSINGFGYFCANTAHAANTEGDSVATAPASNPGSYANTYSYDKSGNRTAANQMGESLSYTPDGENRYSGMSYDADGDATNMTAGWTYAFNAQGQLSSTQRQGDGYTISYAYDGLGRLVYQGSSAGATIFCYAGQRRIEERTASGNTSLYRYFFDSPSSDRIVFRQTSNGTPDSGPRLYYQYDASGNTTHLTNDAGQVVEQYLYDACGTPYAYNAAGAYVSAAGAYDNRYLFHGASAYEWQPLPALYYCRARMYLPLHGRWLQPDPSGFAGGDVNLYRYCGNDPVDLSDSTGLDPADDEDGDQGEQDETGAAPQENSLQQTGYTPTGSHIPSITYTNGDTIASADAINGIQTVALLDPTATMIGGMSFVTPSTGNNSKLEVLGVGQDADDAAATAERDQTAVAYDTNSNPFYDLLVSVIQKLDFGVNVENGYDLASYVNANYDSPPAIGAYSQGALDTVEAVDLYGLQASSITFYGSAVSELGATSAAAAAGATLGGYYTNFFDPSNVYAPSLNPRYFLSGFLYPFDTGSHRQYPIYHHGG